MRTIRVTGKGEIKVHPDMTRIAITLVGRNMDYGKTLKQSSRDTEQLKDLLATFGFERTQLKTLYFSVDTQYESYKERGEYKKRFVGYVFEHRMKLEFESDNQLLGRVLYALANSPLSPEFSLSYTVKDPERAKNELLGKAVTDAAEKARVLTQAAGTVLKEIQSIDYSWGRIELESRPMRSLMLKECEPMLNENSFDMDLEPEDIEVSDTVTIIWEIS